MLNLFLVLTSIYGLTVPLISVPGFRPSYPETLKFYSLASVSAKNFFNWQYNALISIGNPGQNMSLQLDTGSSYITALSVNCDCHIAENNFNSSASSTYVNKTTQMSLEYGKGLVKGTLSADLFSLPGLAAKLQIFILVTEDRNMDSDTSDGVLGLGFKKLSYNYSTFIETLKSQGQIDRGIFSIFLNNFYDPIMDSVLTIGEFNFELYSEGDIKQINIDASSGFWLANISQVGYGDEFIIRKENTFGVFDIGTSMIIGPTEVVDKFFSEVILKGKCSYYSLLICDCYSYEYEEFPSLDFTIDNESYVITPKNYIYQDNKHCYLMIESKNYGYWILGQPFFREYYSGYDMDNKKMFLSKAISRSRPQFLDEWTFIIVAAVSVIVSFILGVTGFRFFTREKKFYEYSLIH